MKPDFIRLIAPLRVIAVLYGLTTFLKLLMRLDYGFL